MDFYKWKWKMKYRWKMVKGFFRLIEYNFRIKHGLTGQHSFYYYAQRDLLRDLVRDDVEEAYLDYHGLLPDEPEPEVEEDFEPEPEQEPGLLRKYDAMDLLYQRLELFDDLYYADSVKEYEDRTVLAMQIMDGKTYEIREEMIEVSHREGQRYDPFVLEGEDWRWDRLDGKIRFCPVVQELPEERANAKPVRILQGFALRVDKALAEERLSPLCLEYAYNCSEAGYDWCVTDGSYRTAEYELKQAEDKQSADKIRRDLALHCPHYWKEAGLSV